MKKLLPLIIFLFTFDTFAQDTTNVRIIPQIDKFRNEDDIIVEVDAVKLGRVYVGLLDRSYIVFSNYYFISPQYKTLNKNLHLYFSIGGFSDYSLLLTENEVSNCLKSIEYFIEAYEKRKDVWRENNEIYYRPTDEFKMGITQKEKNFDLYIVYGYWRYYDSEKHLPQTIYVGIDKLYRLKDIFEKSMQYFKSADDEYIMTDHRNKSEQENDKTENNEVNGL